MHASELARQGRWVEHERIGILDSLIPPEGITLPPENLTINSLSTKFEVHIVEGVEGVGKLIDETYPHLTGVFPDSLAIKVTASPTGETAEVLYFVNSGALGQETIIRETQVAARETSLPIVLGLGWVERDGQRLLRLHTEPASGRETAMVMPNYLPASDFSRVIASPMLGPSRRWQIMEQAVQRLWVYKTALPAGEELRYGGADGTRRLIEQTQQRALTWGPSPSLTALRSSELLSARLDRVFTKPRMRGFLGVEAIEGKVGDQHGDPRLFDNASLLAAADGRMLTVIRDPVRLFQTGRGGLERGWTNFHLSHDLLQLGLLLARPFVDPEYLDLFLYGLEAYERLSYATDGNIIGRPAREQLFGIGLAYGSLVEILVRNYHHDQGPGPTVTTYWRSIESLARTDFLGWRG